MRHQPAKRTVRVTASLTPVISETVQAQETVAVALNDPSVRGQFGHLQVKKAESNHTIIEGDGAGGEQLEEGLVLDWLLQHSILNDQFLVYAAEDGEEFERVEISAVCEDPRWLGPVGELLHGGFRLDSVGAVATLVVEGRANRARVHNRVATRAGGRPSRLPRARVWNSLEKAGVTAHLLSSNWV
jgi:hypothetical protein